MKSVIKLIFLLPLVVVSCGKMLPEPVVDPAEYDGDYSFSQELTVPIGTRAVFIENGTKTYEIPVSPRLVKPTDGKEIEPFGVISLNLVSPEKTAFNAYYLINGQRVNLIDNGLVIKEMANTKADADAPLRLTEPASYETGDPNDNYFTAYHSSGVVMFEDSWPTSLYGNKVEGNPGRGKYDTDFNDLILDYDVEAFTVPDMEKYATQGWREQVKVVLHVRATSAHIGANGCTTEIEKAGLILEGFNMANVESIEAFASMDSWQNPHAPQVEENGVLYDFGLPAWAKRDLAANSQYGVIENRGAFVEIGGIPSLKDKNSSAGSEVYERRNDNASIENHVFNPGLKQYSEWKNPKTEQYDSELAKLYDDYGYATLANTQKTGYYNVVPGYVNVNGGLYTFTVIYHMKDRSEMTEQESEAQLANMIDAVYNTFKQNFYVVTTEGYPIGLQGYAPYDQDKYDEVFAANSSKLDANVTYKSSDAEGYIWAFKCPTLTKHLWNKLPFSAAYPSYPNWVKTNGAENADWYKEDNLDGRFLVCWW